MNYVIYNLDSEPGETSMVGATSMESAFIVIRRISKGTVIMNLNTGKVVQAQELLEMGDLVPVECNNKRMTLTPVTTTSFERLLLTEID